MTDRESPTEYLRTLIKEDEAAVVSQVDQLMRHLRYVKDAVLGKMRSHYEEPLTLHAESGVLDTSRFAGSVMRLCLNLERLNVATAADPTFHVGMMHKHDGEWIYFRSGSRDGPFGWHTVDGDQDRNEAVRAGEA